MDKEVALQGGNITDVVRVGSTVRRPVCDRSILIADFLHRLEIAGFDGAPRYMGRDEKGRDILSYLPGKVYPQARTYTDEQVRKAALLIRSFHDYGKASGLAGEYETMTHGDPNPSNFVWKQGAPYAIIDYDTIWPGDRLPDVAYMAWTWLIGSYWAQYKRPIVEQARQVALFAQCYGLNIQGRDFVAAIGERQDNTLAWCKERLSGVLNDTELSHARSTLLWCKTEKAFVIDNAQVFASAIDRAHPEDEAG